MLWADRCEGGWVEDPRQHQDVGSSTKGPKGSSTMMSASVSSEIITTVSMIDRKVTYSSSVAAVSASKSSTEVTIRSTTAVSRSRSSIIVEGIQNKTPNTGINTKKREYTKIDLNSVFSQSIEERNKLGYPNSFTI